MTPEQVDGAIEQLRSHCKLMEEQRDYTPITVRNTLYMLGFSSNDADRVIITLHERGFNYCLDPLFPVKDPDTGEETPTPEFACYWGPDQLRSRITWCAVR